MGAGQLITGFENELMGMSLNEKKRYGYSLDSRHSVLKLNFDSVSPIS